MFVHYRRVDELSYAFLVAPGQEYKVVGVEAKVWGRPGEGLLELGSGGHLGICFDCRFRGTLFVLMLGS